MKITCKHEKTAEFRILVPGDVFEFEDSIYMRIHDIERANYGGVVNAIFLAGGEDEYFPGETPVYLRTAELIVE